MFALIDCNSFFCSVEKVFHPGLEGKPVVVLSSNDGCIVALTPEAKAVGLHRGDPIFKCRGIVEKHKVNVFSGNMMLYAAMSRRVKSIIRRSVERVEDYSIDESFCDLRGYGEHQDITQMMRELRERILLWTDIPVSIGIAPTRTLAKMGSKFAKQYRGYGGVCLIDSDEKREKALSLFELSDIWGIGRRTLATLTELGVHTPLEFTQRSEQWVTRHFPKPVVQTWMELRGTSCISAPEPEARKTVCTSRSFGEMTGELRELRAGISTFAAGSANKLRSQKSKAKTVTVFVESNRFREDLQQYGNSASITLPHPSSDTIEITEAALTALESIYRSDIQYKRAGVILSDIVQSGEVTGDLFDTAEGKQERSDLMELMDSLNCRYGLKTLRLAVQGEKSEPWMVKCEQKSPNYLTDIRELLTVKA